MEGLQPLWYCRGGGLRLQLVHWMWSGTLLHHLGSNTCLKFSSVLSGHSYSVHSHDVSSVSFRSRSGLLVFHWRQRGWSSLFHVDQQLPNNTLMKQYLCHKKSPFFTYSLLKQRIISERVTLLEQCCSTRLCSPAPPSTFPECQLRSGYWTRIMPWKKGTCYFTGMGYFGLSQCLNLGPVIFEWLFQELFGSSDSALPTILSPFPSRYPIERKP